MTIQKKVKQLVDLGYDNDIIARTLEISTEELNSIKQDLGYKTRLQALKDRYQKAYNNIPADQEKKPKQLTVEQIEEIEKRLEQLEELGNTLNDGRAFGKREEILQNILKSLSYMDSLYLPLEYAEKVYRLLPSRYTVKECKSVIAFDTKKVRYHQKYMDAISDRIEETENVEESTVSTTWKDSYIVVSTLISKIDKKISQISKPLAQQPTEGVKNIVKLVIGEEYHEEEAKKLLEIEAEKYLEKQKQSIEENRQNSYYLQNQNYTIERARKQIRYQIEILVSRSKEYQIQDIDRTYQRLQEFTDDAFRPIIENLLMNKRFDEAKKLAFKCFPRTDDLELAKRGNQYKSKIRLAQIADFIMKGINAPEGSIQDEDQWYEMLDNGIKRSKVFPNTIILGKTKDGLRDITWNDVMEQGTIWKEQQAEKSSKEDGFERV